MDGDGRGEDLVRSLGDVIASHADSSAVVGYALVVVAAVGAVLGPQAAPKILTKLGAQKLVCSALVFQVAAT